MMAHVPFHQRSYHSARAVQQLPTGSNLVGVWGFVLSLVALFFTCGVLSPLALLVSLVGLFRRPRGFAVAGTIISGACTLGIVALVSLIAITAAHKSQRHARRAAALQEAERAQVTVRAQQIAQQAIERYRAENQGQLPEGVEGNKLVLVHHDGWGTELRYDHADESDSYCIRSAGPDHKFDTGDDVVQSNSP